MTIAIHQPNFMPYFPFFQKMAQADMFVLLTYCQYEKNNYQNRFFMNGKWYTMSVRNKKELIREKKYINCAYDWGRIKMGLPIYKKYLDKLSVSISEMLFDTNISIIKQACDMLQIDTPIYMDYVTDLTGTDRLVDICKYYGADKYLSGISGRNYLELDKFDKAGIEVIFQDENEMIRKPLLEILHERGY